MQQPDTSSMLPSDIVKKFALGMHMIQGIPMSTGTTNELLAEIKDMDMHEQDVIVAGFPKSGCLWSLTIVQAIMASNSLDQYSLGEIMPNRKPIEVAKVIFEDIKSQKKPYAFQMHLRYGMLPKQVGEKKVKIIYVSRNPKDVAVSSYHFMKQLKVPGVASSWDEYFDKFNRGIMYMGSWFVHEKDWLKQRGNENVMFVRYEDLIQDPSKNIAEIASFIGKPLDDATLEKITHMTSFNNMKAHPVLNMPVSGKEEGHRFLRKGKVGDWKNWFTEEQSQMIDEKYEQLVCETGIAPHIFE